MRDFRRLDRVRPAAFYRGGAAMPKMKTHKGLKKRVRISATGKVKFKSANAGHLMSGKSGNRKRRLRTPTILKGAVKARIIEACGGVA